MTFDNAGEGRDARAVANIIVVFFIVVVGGGERDNS